MPRTVTGSRGPTRQEESSMTRDKARKAAARQRVAETGEPYSVARRAVLEHPDQFAGEADQLWDLAHEALDLAEEAQDLADTATRRGTWARHEARWAEQRGERAERLRGRLDQLTRGADWLRDGAGHLARMAEAEWSRSRAPGRGEQSEHGEKT
jgi:hypothetical protein